MKFLALTITILLLSSSVPAYADTPQNCTIPLSVADPCIGVLLPPEAATKGLDCLQVQVPKLKLDIEFQKKRYDLKINTLTQILDAEKVRADKIEGLLNTSLEKVEAPKWYEHPVFWATVGFAIGAGTAIGIAYAIGPAAK